MRNAIWSETLSQQTREIFNTSSALAGQFVPMKHIDGRFALVRRETDGHGFIVVDRRSGGVAGFATLEDLLVDGWAAD